MAIIATRKIDNGHSIRYKKKYYKLIDENGLPIFYYAGVKCIVIEAFDGKLYTAVNERVYALIEIPKHEYTSRNFDFKGIKKEPKKQYIPPMSHPWKKESFEKHLKSQKHVDPDVYADFMEIDDIWNSTHKYS